MFCCLRPRKRNILGGDVHLNVFKTRRSEAIGEAGRLNHSHRVEQMHKAKQKVITTICAGKDATGRRVRATWLIAGPAADGT
jgi:hypothetical protein